MLSMGSLIATLMNYAKRNNAEASLVACSESYMQRFEQQVKGRVVVLTTDSFHIMDHDF